MPQLDFFKAKELILGAKSIFLATHREPDADAIGSMLALGAGLEEFGKKVFIYVPAALPASFDFLLHGRALNQLSRSHTNLGVGARRFVFTNDAAHLAASDLMVAADYGDFKRLGLPEDVCAAKPLISFDHHILGGQRGLLLVDEAASSSCEIIYDFLRFLDVRINGFAATCLLTGIFGDTGGFRHASTSAKVLRIASELLLLGAAYGKIIKNLKFIDFEGALPAWLLGMEKAVFDKLSGLVYAYISRRDFSEEEGCLEKFSGFSQILSTVPGAKLAVLLIEREPGLIQGSVRSQLGRGVDAAAIARLFGGGGIKLAAGFQTNESAEAVVEKIKKQL